MRRATLILLVLLLLLYIATIVLSIVSLIYNIIKKGFLITYIVFDSFSAINIIYLFCCMEKFFFIFFFMKYILFFFNIANIGLIIYTVFDVDEILTKNKVMIFILSEIFIFMKNVYSYYFHGKS